MILNISVGRIQLAPDVEARLSARRQQDDEMVRSKFFGLLDNEEVRTTIVLMIARRALAMPSSRSLQQLDPINVFHQACNTAADLGIDRKEFMAQFSPKLGDILDFTWAVQRFYRAAVPPEKVEELASGEDPAFEAYLDKIRPHALFGDESPEQLPVPSEILEGLALKYAVFREEGKADVLEQDLDTPEWQEKIFAQALRSYAKVHLDEATHATTSAVLDVLEKSCGDREAVKARVIQRALQLRVEAEIRKRDSSMVQTVRDALPGLGDFCRVTRELAPSVVYDSDQVEYLGRS